MLRDRPSGFNRAANWMRTRQPVPRFNFEISYLGGPVPARTADPPMLLERISWAHACTHGHAHTSSLGNIDSLNVVAFHGAQPIWDEIATV